LNYPTSKNGQGHRPMLHMTTFASQRKNSTFCIC